MLAGAIPVVSELFQALLNGLGWVLATIYRFIPNYGVSIILLTLLIKFLLVPLGIKQIKSMQLMQSIQPKIKEIQKRNKGNKAKTQEETMKLYKEAGVNPLGGCLPLLLQFPVLISMYAVLRLPTLEPTTDAEGQQAYIVQNNHLPVDSKLFSNVIEHENTGVIIVNLQCSAVQSGDVAILKDTKGQPIEPDRPLINGADDQSIPTLTSRSTLDCGDSPVARIPYFVLLALMVASTFYQQRQMTKASPASAASSQTKILQYMPLMFGVIGINFPAGLVLYWTVSNGFQIAQQTLLMRAGHIGPDALDKRMAEQREKNAAKGDQPAKKGYMARMLEQAQQERNDPKGTKGTQGSKPPTKSGKPGSTPPKPSGPRRKPNTGGKGGSGGSKGSGPKKRPGGGSDGSTG